MSKRGISAVVATVLIVLTAVGGVAIVWVGVMPMLNDDLGNINGDVQLRIVSAEGYTVQDEDSELVTVQVERIGDSEICELDLIFVINGNSVTNREGDVPAINSKKVYYVNLSDYPGDLSKISVAPVFCNGEAGDVTEELKDNDIPQGDLQELIDNNILDEDDFEEPNEGNLDDDPVLDCDEDSDCPETPWCSSDVHVKTLGVCDASNVCLVGTGFELVEDCNKGMECKEYSCDVSRETICGETNSADGTPCSAGSCIGGLCVDLGCPIGDVCYYVDSAAVEGGDGQTDETAWNNLSDINWVDMSWHVSVGNKVNINFKRGSVFDEILNIQASGVNGRPITIQAYGSGNRPIMDRITLYNQKSYVNLNGLKVVMAEALKDSNLLALPGSSYVSVNDCMFDGMGIGNQHTHLVDLSGNAPDYAHDIVFTNTTFKNSGDATALGGTDTGGLNIVSDVYNVLVDNCTFIDNAAFGIQVYGASATHVPQDMEFKNCIITNTAPPIGGQQGEGINIGWYAKNINVHNNYVEKQYTGIGFDGRITEVNYVTDNEVVNSLELIRSASPHGVITGNILTSGGSTVTGIFLTDPIGGGGERATVYNNTITMLKSWWPSITLPPSGTYTGDNNIFINPEGSSFMQVGPPNTYVDLATWRINTGQETNSIDSIMP